MRLPTQRISHKRRHQGTGNDVKSKLISLSHLLLLRSHHPIRLGTVQGAFGWLSCERGESTDAATLTSSSSLAGCDQHVTSHHGTAFSCLLDFSPTSIPHPSTAWFDEIRVNYNRSSLAGVEVIITYLHPNRLMIRFAALPPVDFG